MRKVAGVDDIGEEGVCGSEGVKVVSQETHLTRSERSLNLQWSTVLLFHLQSRKQAIGESDRAMRFFRLLFGSEHSAWWVENRCISSPSSLPFSYEATTSRLSLKELCLDGPSNHLDCIFPIQEGFKIEFTGTRFKQLEQ